MAENCPGIVIPPSISVSPLEKIGEERGYS
jgi:hypothetical protein